MASEILAIPEQHLEEFITFITEALMILGDQVSDDLNAVLEEWCKRELEYLSRCNAA